MNKLLETYYNKFNEDKRLLRRHGLVEYYTTIKYLDEVLNGYKNPKVLDVGAGTGVYSKYLSDRDYDVTAVELVKHNLRVLNSKIPGIKSYLGNALDLSFLKNNKYDVILLFGPIYHLFGNDKSLALKEALKYLNTNGTLMIIYCLNDYAILKHGFIDGNIIREKDNLNDCYLIKDKEDNLYSFDTLESIDKLNKECHLKRIKIISQEGMGEYIRPILNKMSEEEFKMYMDFHLKRCENYEYLGLSRHVLDIVKTTRN